VKIYSKIDKGIVRNSNQDAYFAGEISQEITFAVVCDGMGGAKAGNVASTAAVKSISEYIANSYRNNMSLDDITKMLRNAIISANIEVYDMATQNEQLQGMGTTVVAAVVRNGNAVIANVGDSRVYLVDDNITQLTTDHSIVQTLIESGKITVEDAKVHPRKNVITRALGAESDVAVDIAEYNLSENNTLLLCTDGLTNFVSEEDILKTFKENDISVVSEKLVELANIGGGGDNITAVTLTM
jgi:protein phosphatase